MLVKYYRNHLFSAPREKKKNSLEIVPSSVISFDEGKRKREGGEGGGRLEGFDRARSSSYVYFYASTNTSHTFLDTQLGRGSRLSSIISYNTRPL